MTVSPPEPAEAETADDDRPPLPPPPRPRRLLALLIGMVLAGILAVVLFVGLHPGGGSTPTGSGPSVPVGSTAPNFSLPSLTSGPAVSLDKLGSGRDRPVVLNFFASWCGPCQKETPLLAATARSEQAKGSPVQFIGVDVADTHAAALAFVQKSGIAYPVGVDAKLAVAANLYGLQGEPSTFFINADGQVVAHVKGAVDRAQLEQWLHRLAGASG